MYVSLAHKEFQFELKQRPGISNYWYAKRYLLFIIWNVFICNMCVEKLRDRDDEEWITWENNASNNCCQRWALYLVHISSLPLDSMVLPLHKIRLSLNWIDHFGENVFHFRFLQFILKTNETVLGGQMQWHHRNRNSIVSKFVRNIYVPHLDTLMLNRWSKYSFVLFCMA